MSRKAALPYDVRQECLWIVRGYDRRRREYLRARRDVIESGGQSYTTAILNGEECRIYPPHGNGNGHPVEEKAEKLAAIEEWPETQRMRAVEIAKAHIGADLENLELRQRLMDGILLNCKSGQKYPFQYLNLEGISRRSFYRQREKFLIEIAKILGIYPKVGTE